MSPRSRDADGSDASERLVRRAPRRNARRHPARQRRLARRLSRRSWPPSASRSGDSAVVEGQKVICDIDEPTSAGQAAHDRPHFGLFRRAIEDDDRDERRRRLRAGDAGDAAAVASAPADDARTIGRHEPLRKPVPDRAQTRHSASRSSSRWCKVFANDVDFQRAAAPGDAIEAFYCRARRDRRAHPNCYTRPSPPATRASNTTASKRLTTGRSIITTRTAARRASS